MHSLLLVRPTPHSLAHHRALGRAQDCWTDHEPRNKGRMRLCGAETPKREQPRHRRTHRACLFSTTHSSLIARSSRSLARSPARKTYVKKSTFPHTHTESHTVESSRRVPDGGRTDGHDRRGTQPKRGDAAAARGCRSPQGGVALGKIGPCETCSANGSLTFPFSACREHHRANASPNFHSL
jgi:hypothetical protein